MIPSLFYAISEQWNASLAVEVIGRWFNSNAAGLFRNTHRDGRICDSGIVVWRSGNRGAFRPARVGHPDIFGESDVKLFGLQLSPMDSRCRDQDGLALLTDAGCLLGDCAQRLCLRTTKRYPASFGGRQGSHSALRDKPVLVVHGLPRARGRSQGCRAKFDPHSLAGAAAWVACCCSYRRSPYCLRAVSGRQRPKPPKLVRFGQSQSRKAKWANRLSCRTDQGRKRGGSRLSHRRPDH